MRLVKCRYCGKQNSNTETYKVVNQTQKSKTTKHYCNEQCYLDECSQKLYRKKVIGFVYNLLSIRVADGGALINKKLKELEYYNMQQIYETLCDNEFELQMLLPSSGTMYSKIAYLFAVLKSKMYDKYENVTTDKNEQLVEQDKKTNEQKHETVTQEQFIPMKKIKRETKKVVEELILDF